VLRGSVAIVGLAEYGLGVAPEGSTPVDVMGNAALAALDDAGLTTADVDGLFAASTQMPWASVNLGEFLGVQPRYSDSTQLGGSSFMAHLHHAALAITGGACDVAVIGYGSTQRSVGRAKASVQEIDPGEAPYRPMNPITAYALAASRHMYEFGTTREQLALVAVAASRWAALNPEALKREPLSVDDVIGSPLVSDPLRKLDICLVTNGAGAVVVTSRDRARSCARRAVTVLGAGESHNHAYISNMPSFVATAASASSAAAYEMAGLGPADMDFAQIYDAFTIMVIMGLEDLGFCAKGEGGSFVERGIGPGAVLPVNTSGGGLRYCHPGMFGIFALIEGVRQLRGECGARQVDRARLGLVHGFGGIFAGNATVVLGNDA